MEFKNAALAKLSPNPAKTATYWDTVVRGLGLWVTPGGVKTFGMKYRFAGRQVMVKLGRLGELTVDEARKRAIGIRQQVNDGIDPAAKKARGMTVGEAALRMLEEHAPRVRARTLEGYGDNVKRYIIAALGRLSLAALSLPDVAAFHNSMRSTPRTANHALSVLSVICRYAEAWGERPLGTNPCRHQPNYPVKARHRYLTDAEIAAVGRAAAGLAGRHSQAAIDALRLIMLTGARKGEIINLRWEYVDMDGGRILLPPFAHKTGGETIAKQIPLGAAAVDLLRGQKGRQGEVFPGMTSGGLKWLWDVVRREASKGGVDVRDVRVHDLRHTWGAMATSGGHALQVIGAVMGHRDAATTARYAHVAPSPAARAVEDTSARIAAALGGKNKKGAD
jgi:integrase